MFAQRVFISVFAICCFSLSASAEGKSIPREGVDFFEKNIRPVLNDRCYKCHSLQSKKVKGGLLLDSHKTMLQGGETGPAIVPFQPEKSLLIKAIHWSDPDLQMPPKEKLPPEQIKNFEIWINMGAPDPRTEVVQSPKSKIQDSSAPYDYAVARTNWAFQNPKNPAIPKVKNKTWPASPIDNFILAKLEEKGLRPTGLANKRTLLRRATFDLTGLPPRPEEIQSFLDDKSANAFEKVVDRLLASPGYGEQWGRHWLDVVRYADTSGCNSDYPIPQAYKYRNYVIKSFNQDKPFHEFIREQIAGDLLPSETDEEKFEKIIATGYLAISRRFGSRNNEFHLTIEDTIDSVGKGILGLSVSCARCHDHKFDPIPTKDYYALYGIFESTKYAFPGTEIYKHPKDFVPLATGTNIAAVFKYQTDLALLDDEIDKLGEKKRELLGKLMKDEEEKKSASEEKTKFDDDEKELRVKIREVKADLEDARYKQKKLEADPPPVEKAYAVSEGKPVNAKIQKKGSPENLGDETPRGFLKILGGQTLPPEEKGSGRLELAQWLTENPLTARVMVNRIWQHHFGKGIVATPNDFGVRGKAPSHPELLDFLATQFVQNGWSI
ncbi:MAG: PSD1 and planctomycete cytochrome C domain-containing protein, partial [Limisphaerales bacterium]